MLRGIRGFLISRLTLPLLPESLPLDGQPCDLEQLGWGSSRIGNSRNLSRRRESRCTVEGINLRNWTLDKRMVTTIPVPDPSKERSSEIEKCSVKGCDRKAVAEVILYDVYSDGELFFEQDRTCPFICAKHLIENEEGAKGERKPRGMVAYPHTNQHVAQGFTIYRPL